MTQEDKELLLKDIYARIPYEVKGCCEGETFVTSPLYWYAEDTLEYSINYMIIKNGWRPYLFPLSSMTEEQRKTLKVMCDWNDEEADAQSILVLYQKHFVMKTDVIDWLNENHFDYRGLIEKGLAIDATGKNIY
jgi:hypothetical protein